MKNKALLLFLFIPLLLSAQDRQNQFDKDVEQAFVHAKKGVYFALSNIPESKGSMNQDLIEDDTLIASIKLTKETNGVRVESTGIYKTYSVEIVVYRSYDSLENDGFR